MTTQTRTPYYNEPKFLAAMDHFQNGEWDAGLTALDLVQRDYPNTPDIKTLREEILLKRQLDDEEVIDERKDQTRKLRRIGIRLAILALVFVFIFWGVQTFSGWIVGQWTNIQQGIMADVRMFETAIQYRDAQSYLLSNQPEAALDVLEEISKTDPNYPGLDTLYVEVEGLLLYKSRYDEAILNRDEGNILTALEQFESINQEQPDYLDVAIQIQNIQGDLYLVDLLAQAEDAYDAENWDAATSQYETLRAIAPYFQTELVDQRLIRSYMNLGTQILQKEDRSPETLKLADNYFRKVLVLRPRDETLLTEQNRVKEQFKARLFDFYVQTARETVIGQEDSRDALEIATRYLENALLLRPNDTNVMLELDLARNYLQAQIDFEEGLVNSAITKLEFIYANAPHYANGTALQTLYESYMVRGSAYSATGELEPALSDFQSAAEMAALTDNPVLKLYFAKVKIAETVGILNNYAVAVNNYKEAATLIDLETILAGADGDLSYLLREAERYADIEWYRTSYRLYRRVLPATDLILDKVEIIVIKEGDYLSSLAKIYNTTVEEIVKANALPSAGNLQMGQEIIIPTLKELDE